MSAPRQPLGYLLLLAAVMCGVARGFDSSNFGFAGPDSGPGFSVPGTSAVKSDIKYIRCEVCNLLAKQAYRQVKALEKELKPGKKLSEFKIIETLEKITNPVKDEGEWLGHLDLVEEGDKLVVQEMPELGKCGSECKTAQKAAEQIVEGIDTDMAEKLWQGKMSRAQFTNWLCQEATSACKGRPPKLPASRPKGPAFEVLDAEEAKMQKMMATMKEMGMGGQVFSRDQAQKMADGGEEYDEYADDSNLAPDAGVSPHEEEAPEASESSKEGGVWDTLSSLTQGVQDAAGAAKEAAKKGQELASGLLSKAQDLLPSKAPSEEL